MAKRMLGPSGGKRRRSLRWLLPLVVLLTILSVSVFTQAGGALTTANPPTFTFVNDEQGADDQPGQKDLSAQAVAVPSPGDLWVAWKWDVTSLSGSNTGDACALFDTNTNAKVNFAICVTIAGSPAAQLAGVSPRVYTCGDGKVDRCTSTITQITPIGSACDVTFASDPFHTGQQDTEAFCHVDLNDVGGATSANLINTCSYPSQQPNSDPSDCVLIPRDAFIRIAKTADPNSGSFPFNLDGTLAFTASGTQTSSYIAITSGTSHPHSVQELVPTGWSITGTPSCTGTSGSGSNPGTYSGTTKTISGIIANSDNQVTCSFSDQQQRATLDVSKTASDSDSTAQNGAVFTLYSGPDTTGTVIGTCTVSSGHCGPNTPSFSNLVTGQYTLDETSVPTGYTKPSSLPSTFTLSPGQASTLSFEDAAQPGSVTISKLDDKGNVVVGAVFTLYQPASGTTDPPTGTAVTGGACTTDGTGACTISNLASGTYTINEAPPTGYAKDASFPKDITVSRGTATNVSATDAKLFKVIVLVCQKTDDQLYASKVSFDTAGLPTNPNSPIATGDAAIDETKLCQLSGTYVHDNAQRNHDHTATIRIP